MALLAFQFDFHAFAERIISPTPQQWHALAMTVCVAIAAEIFGIVLGAILYAATRSRFAPLRIAAYLYVLFTRGTPVIVQIFAVFFGANLFLGFDLFPRSATLFALTIPGAAIAGVVALGLNEGAYMSETIRAGMDSVDRGQLEAAQCVGMTKRTATRHIIVPQAIRIILPPFGNQFNAMLKTTSLLSFIGVPELFQDSQTLYAQTFQPVEVLSALAIWYLVLTMAWSLVQIQLERKFGQSDRIENEFWIARLLGIQARPGWAR